MATFDTQAAKAAGYSDEEIAKVTSGIEAAKKAGYDDSEISQFLSTGLERSTTLSSAGTALGKGAVRGAVAAGDTASMIENIMPVTGLLRRGAKALAPDITRRAGESVKQFRERLLAQNRADPNATTVERMLGTGAEFATQGALTGGLGGTARQAATNILTPAIGAAVGEQIGTPGEGSGETGKFIGALASPFIASRIGAALKPDVSPALKRLVEAGGQPTTGQITGGGIQRLESFPILNQFTQGALDTSTRSYTLAANNLALEPLRLGKQPLGKIDLSKVSGNDLYAKADDIAQDAYNKLLPQLKLKLDPQLPQELAAIKAAHPEVADKLQNIQNTIFKIMSKKGTTAITGADMKIVESKLGRQLRKANLSNDIMADELADGVAEMQGALRDMVARQNPSQAKELQRINEAWSNLVRVRKATIGASSTNDGFFNPQQLARAVTAVNASRTGQAVARGESGMQNVARAGIEHMSTQPGKSLPYSALARGAGTLGTLGTLGGGAAAGAGLGAAGIGTGVGLGIAGGLAGYGAAYTPTAQGVIRNFLTSNRGPLPATLGEILRDTRTNPAFVTNLPQFNRGEQD